RRRRESPHGRPDPLANPEVELSARPKPRSLRAVRSMRARPRAAIGPKEPIMNSRRCYLAAIGLAVGAVARCASSSGPSLPPCTDPVTLTATTALEPGFAWTPNCLVDQVTLEENIAPSAGGPQARWAMRSRVTGQGKPSPDRYGDVAASMAELTSAAAAAAGQAAYVSVLVATVEAAPGGLRLYRCELR